MIIRTIKPDAPKQRNDVEGKCANCGATLREGLFILDDAYLVWVGKCGGCEAWNLLDFTKGRGYSSVHMDLVLPTTEEVEQNKWDYTGPTQ